MNHDPDARQLVFLAALVTVAAILAAVILGPTL